MTGKCPKCEKQVSNVAVGHVRMSTGLASRSAFHGVAYLCPFCDTILGVGVDPAAASDAAAPAEPAARKRRAPRRT